MKIRYNREIISGAIFCGSERSAVVPDSRTGPDAGENANQRTDLPPVSPLVVCSSALSVCLLEDLRPGEAGVVCDEREFSLNAFKKEMRSVVFALLLIAYCFLIGHLGYIVSTILLVLAVMMFYKARKWYYYAIPLGMVGIVYYVFKVLLHISLP